MLRVLVIDSDDDRREAIQSRLSDDGLIVSNMAMLGVENIPKALINSDIIIMLNQTPEFVTACVKVNANDRARVLITNMPQSSNAIPSDQLVFLNNNKTIEQTIYNRIALILKHQEGKHSHPIAEDPRSKATLELARKAAKSNATVLISGETGAGKEVLARYIHQHSTFNLGPFVSVNCAALPENMIEAILFGYEKGAFTSAINAYMGKFEQAQNGTLLLDEISEISIGLQAKLLRVLQEREVERLGGKKIIPINVRIIAATNRDLNQQVIAGEFRKDLFYRLNVIPIQCAALRERPMDILPMAEFLCEQHAKQMNRNVPTFTDAAQKKLKEYHWPGNIREMDNIIQRVLIMTEGDVIDEEDFFLNEENIVKENANVIVNLEQFSSKLEANEAQVIIDVLKEVDGCRNSAAKKLNISPRTLRYKIAKLRSIGLKVPK